MTTEAQDTSEVEIETKMNLAGTADVADVTGMAADTPCDDVCQGQPRHLSEEDLAAAVAELLQGWSRVGGIVLFNMKRSLPAVSQFVCESSKCRFAKVQPVTGYVI